MWVFLNDAFLSIVADRHSTDRLLIRARRRCDISRYFPEAEVLELDQADYRYRAFVCRPQVSRILATTVEDIDYDNFKSSVADQERHDVYMDVWVTMNRYQR